ncbi:MAG TPA: glycosyltransferase [Rudaea sp.]|nr:glycosyltransferase [Rudaea sp.]
MPASPRGVLYCGSGDLSGYGQAAIAYVRALVNAGVPVQWIPLDWLPERMAAGSWTLPDGRPRRLLEQCGTHGHLADVTALVGRTSAPVAHDTVIVQAPPEAWPQVFESGKRNIGVTVWETDRAPAHWLPLMRLAERVIVPCEFNRTAFLRSGLERPVHVVPHIRRHSWREYAPSDVARARAKLGIPAGNRVFYTINAWDPRKNTPALVRAFARAFAADAPVSLLIKTGATGHGDAPFYPVLPTRELVLQAMRDATAETGRQPAQIILVDAELDGDDIDLIHALGDIFVSLTHGEGWGLGAFEAATLGKPVIMTAWGGQCAFLGESWPGAVPCALEPVPLWPPHKPSYFPSQRWAAPVFDDAVARLRAIAADPEPALAAAHAIRERIVRNYAEPVVVDTLLEAIT